MASRWKWMSSRGTRAAWAASEAASACSSRQGPRHEKQAQGRAEGELETDVADPRRMMDEEGDGGQAEQVRQVGIQVQRAAGEHHDGRDRGPRDRHVATDEDGVEDERRRGEDGRGERGDLETGHRPQDEPGHQGDLGARKGKDVVGAGDAKGLGRFGLDARAVAQHHRPDESLLGTRQDVPEQGFPDVLPRPRRGVAEPPDAGPAELLDEPAALDVAVGVNAVAPGLGRGVEGAGRAEAVGRAQQRPRLDAITRDDDGIGAGGRAADVEARPARGVLVAAPDAQLVHVDEDLEAVRRGPSIDRRDAAQEDRLLALLVDGRPSSQRRPVVAGRLGRRGASGDRERRPRQGGQGKAWPTRRDGQDEERGGQGGEDPARSERRGCTRSCAQRDRDGEKEQWAAGGHPRRVGARRRRRAAFRAVTKLSY